MMSLLGWVGNLGFLYGAFALGKKRMSGWYAQIFANLCYVIQAIYMKNTPLWVVSIVLIGVNVYGIYSWTKITPKKSIYDKVKKHAEHSYVVEMMKERDN